jgi:hypothetical protein
MLFRTFCYCHFVHLNRVVNYSSSQVSIKILPRLSNIQRKLNWLRPISQVIIYKYLLYDTLGKSILRFVVVIDDKHMLDKAQKT